MSANFSVNPVGLPGAAAPVRAPAPAADEGVPTQLSPRRSVVAIENADTPRMDAQTTGHELARRVVIDRAAATMVYQVVDKRSGEVMQQFPEQAVLRRRAYVRTLDALRDAGAELPHTDRTV